FERVLQDRRDAVAASRIGDLLREVSVVELDLLVERRRDRLGVRCACCGALVLPCFAPPPGRDPVRNLLAARAAMRRCN
ncbi:MAG: hypothetical protein WD489_02225, partial [Rhodovibrionaceae bacterium]